MRLGFHVPPTIAPERLRSLAVAAEDAGLDELWVWEDCFKQTGVASATAALAWTERLDVGISLMPVPLRNPALTAMEIATIARMFPGRFTAGIGHGVQFWMGQAGAKPASPLTLLAEHATAIRHLLTGETVTTSGRYVQLDEVKLDWPPDPIPPLMIGGFGPKSVALAAELGDGNLFGNAFTDDQVRDLIAAVRAAKTAAGRPDADRPRIVAAEIAATGAGAQQRLDAELPIWGAEPGAGVGVAGDAAAIAGSARRYASFGVTSYGIQPTADEPDLEGFIRFIGTEVAPLIDAA